MFMKYKRYLVGVLTCCMLLQNVAYISYAQEPETTVREVEAPASEEAIESAERAVGASYLDTVIGNDENGIPDPNLYQAIFDAVVECHDDEVTEITIRDLRYNITQISSGEFIYDLKGLEYCTNMYQLTLTCCYTDDLSPLSELTYLDYLSLDGGVIDDISALSNLTNLTWLALDGNQISDISALSELSSLQTLWINDNQIADISPLAELECLEDVDLRDNQISDISPLAGRESIESLYLGNNRISDISPLSELTNLTELRLEGNLITELSALSKLTKIRDLDVSNNQLTSLKGLEDMTELQWLWCEENQLTDISALKNAESLLHISMSNNQISDISALSASTNLLLISAGDNNISDISALEGCTDLGSVYMNNNEVSSIEPLRGKTKMVSFDMANNKLTDISALEGMNQLQGINVADNQLTSLKGLAGMTILGELKADNNEITDISALAEVPNLTHLDLSYNAISDIRPLAECIYLKDFNLSYNQIIFIDALKREYNTGVMMNVDLSHNSIIDPSPINHSIGWWGEVDLSYNQIQSIDGIPRLLDCYNGADIDLRYNKVADIKTLQVYEQVVLRLEIYWEGLDGNPIMDNFPTTAPMPGTTPAPTEAPTAAPTATPTEAPTATPVYDEAIGEELLKRVDEALSKKPSNPVIKIDISDMDFEWGVDYSVDALANKVWNDYWEYFFISSMYNYNDGIRNQLRLNIYRGFQDDGVTNWTKIDGWISAMQYEKEQAFSMLTEEMSNAEKAVILYNYLLRNCQYEFGDNEGTAYGGLVQGAAVCEGYAHSLQMLLLEAGIEAKIVESPMLNHAWVLLRMEDGTWYHADPTWDDGGIGDTNTGDPKYGIDDDGSGGYGSFLKSDEEFMEGAYTDWTRNVPVAEKSGTFAGYCFYNNSLVNYCNSYWYYIVGASDYCSLVKSSFDGKNKELIALGESAYYLCSHEDMLYYSTEDKVYCYDTNTGAKEVYYDAAKEYPGYVISEFSIKHQKNLFLTLYHREEEVHKEMELPLEETTVSTHYLSNSVMKLTSVGEKKQLSVNFVPAYADNIPDVTWSSEDTAVATVDANGEVTAVGEGITRIVAKNSKGEELGACQVVMDVAVAVTGVEILTESLVLTEQRQMETLEYRILPDNADDTVVYWESSNISVARVDDLGAVTAISEGTAVITVYTQDGGFTDTLEVTVKFSDVVPEADASGYVDGTGQAMCWTYQADTKTVTITGSGVRSKPYYLDNRNASFFPEDTEYIVFDNCTLSGDLGALFSHMWNVISIDVSSLTLKDITNTKRMFAWCNSLTSIDLSGLNTSKVTDMSEMFKCCNSLTSLDVSSLDTSKVTSMYEMFYECSKLGSLDVSGFDTGRVESFNRTFSNCQSLETLDVSGFDTGSAKSMQEMFSGCTKLKNLDVSNFDTDNVGSMAYMFSVCEALEALDVSGFDTGNTISFRNMFYKCRKLKTLDVSGFSTENVRDMRHMFGDCRELETIDVSGFDTTNVMGVGYMFYGCNKLEHLDLSSFKLESLEKGHVYGQVEKMLTDCFALSSIVTPEYVGDVAIDLPAQFSDGTTEVTQIAPEMSKVPLMKTGELVSQEDIVKAFVQRMYTVALGRDAETEGLQFWTKVLIDKERDGAGVSAGFIISDEFVSKNYSDNMYVKVLYETFFNREADGAGEEYWCRALAQGESRNSVLSGFVNSQEFFDLCASFGISKGVMLADGGAVNPGIYNFAERLYSSILGRSGDKEGIEFWTIGIHDGSRSPEEAAMDFFRSGEYLARNSTDEEYICTLYSTFMNREADEGGLSYWKSVLANGASRQDVLRDFAWSPEFKVIMAEFGL